MISTTCTRRIQFCSGHRVVGHENKCKNLHGHNYVALFEASVDELDSVGRVIDFSVLKDRMGGWVDANWDHRFLMWEHDPLLKYFPAMWEVMQGTEDNEDMGITIVEFNPTAENMAEFLLWRSGTLLQGTDVVLSSVTLWETENCFAKATI